MVFLIFSFSNAQQNNLGWSSSLPDTLAGADSLYFTPGVLIPTYDGVVSFNYLITDIEDSLNNCIMQGSNDNVNWIDVATDPQPVVDSTLQDVNPNYLYYRLFMSTPAGDSVQVDAVRFVYKEYQGGN
jgi:hypothetical protein